MAEVHGKTADAKCAAAPETKVSNCLAEMDLFQTLRIEICPKKGISPIILF